jgi:DNA-binding CsgD family transcriptional regulator
MDPSRSAAIDIVEAAYDLEVPESQWLPNVLAAGSSLLDFGMGYYGVISAGESEAGVPMFTQVHTSPGAEGLPTQVFRAAQQAGPELVAKASAGLEGKVYLLSELREKWRKAHDLIVDNVGCADMLSITAVDPNRHGVHISIPCREPTELTPHERDLCRMIEVHLAAGHRLRRSLCEHASVAGVPATEMPLDAEALIDPARFSVAQATGDAKTSDAAEIIRDAARQVDKARGPLRNRDAEEALRLWKGLVRGRWSLVDWFDTDGRRFVLAKPNDPKVRDPRGLTKREAQITTYAALGESSKIIGYRLGLSQSYVSRLLNDGMRKLGVKTQAELVERMRGLQERPSQHP